MHPVTMYLFDLVAVSILVFGLYAPRHRRRDLVVAYLGVNVGVLAVSSSLSNAAVGAGLGLGLFGVLSIIRLRSTEIDQREVAYYFSALAIGLLAPLGQDNWVQTASLMGLILLVMFVGDHPRMMRRQRRQVIVLDAAFLDQRALVAHLERLLGARIRSVSVERLDLVNDTTIVEVRYVADETAARERHSEPLPTPRSAASRW